MGDAAPLYRNAPEALEAKASSGGAFFLSFMRETLSDVPDDKRIRASDLIMATLSSVGKRFSETPRTALEIDAYADAIADMFCAYVDRLARK